MLQILLAFLAISIISVSGYGLTEQLSLQQIMTDQRENMRRLDTAADAIQGRLVTMPGLDGVFAPAPLNLGSGWSYMPAGLGGINATVDGVPFVYCPVSSVDGSGTGNVNSPDGSSYGINVKSGVVVASHLVASGGGNQAQLDSVVGSYRPVAFIIAAGRGDTTPPSCGAIASRNGRPFVEGGIVKVVSNPLNPGATSGVGTISSASSDLYVADGSTGSGRSNDPSSLDDALQQWSAFHPATMTIHLVGNASVGDTGNWQRFVSVLGASDGRLTLDGGGFTMTAPANQLQTPGSLTLANLSLAGPTVVVPQGDQLNIVGNVILAPGSSGSSVFVQQGARLTVASGARLYLTGSSDNGVESAGDVFITGGQIASQGKSWSLGLTNGGRLQAAGSQIGDPNARSQLGALAVAGASSVTSDGSSAIAAGANGQCWSTLSASDATFSYSANQSGASSVVTPDPSDPGLADPTNDAQVQAYQQYKRDVGGRQLARQTNHSSFQCN